MTGGEEGLPIAPREVLQATEVRGGAGSWPVRREGERGGVGVWLRMCAGNWWSAVAGTRRRVREGERGMWASRVQQLAAEVETVRSVSVIVGGPMGRERRRHGRRCPFASCPLPVHAPITWTASFTFTGQRCDLNADSQLTTSDVRNILSQTLGTSPAAADLNGDGAVTIVDAQLLINAVTDLGACPV